MGFFKKLKSGLTGGHQGQATAGSGYGFGPTSGGQQHQQQQQQQQGQYGYGPQSAGTVRPAPYPTAVKPGNPSQPAPHGYQQTPAQYGGASAPGQYGAPPQQQHYGAESPAGFAPPQQTGGTTGTAPATGPGSDFVPLLRANLGKLVATNKLQAFYPPQRLEELLATLAQVDFRALAARWNMPAELALDVAALALYDVVIMADDSTSMKYADDGARIGDLKNMLERIAEVACLFDTDGISIRAINSASAGDGIRTAAQADAYIGGLRFSGMTPLGTAIEQRVITPFVVQPAQQLALSKPVLLITITDGEPTNEPEQKIFQVIKRVKDFMGQTPYGSNAIAFQFAQVGKDQDAQAFLGKLDNDPVIGGMVDATSYYELEAAEYAKKGVVLTPDLWMVKLMVGAVDPSYDEQD